jgi:hypothetical protein
VENVRQNPGIRQDFAVTEAMRRELHQRMRAAGIDVTWEVFEGARRFIDLQLVDEIARAKFGPSVAAVRDDVSDRVLQEAVRRLQAAPTPQALLQNAQPPRTAGAPRR